MGARPPLERGARYGAIAPLDRCMWCGKGRLASDRPVTLARAARVPVAWPPHPLPLRLSSPLLPQDDQHGTAIVAGAGERGVGGL